VSHPEQLGFFSAVASANRELIEGGRVLEIGSYDVNGTARSLFPATEYVGADLVAGPGVDLVGYGHDIDLPDAYFDVAISGECFEHDPHWRATFENMVRLTRPGGLVAFTCASRGRPEHGTARTKVKDSPGTQSLGVDYYRNLTAADFEELPLAELFSEYSFWYQPTHFDLFFAGIRAGGSGAMLPNSSDVESLGKLMSASDRLARLPLRLALRLVPEPLYQSLVLPYWKTLSRSRDYFRGSQR
jgi:SAM-dependent methyltransferase